MNATRRSITISELVTQALVLLIILFTLYPGVFLRGEVALGATLLFQIDPWKEHAPPEYEETRNDPTLESLTAFSQYFILSRRALRSGEWPLWNHLALAGTPLLAAFQASPFYPPHVLHVIFDPFFAMTFYVLFKVWMCGATAYLLGRTLRLSVPASRLLSIGWMLSGYCMVWSYWPLTDEACWVPLLLMGAEFMLSGRYRKGFFTTALAGTLLLLAGHPETAFIMAVGVCAYFVLRLLLDGRRGQALWRPLLTLGAAWVLVLVVCAAQVLPFLEYLPNSHTLQFRPEAVDKHFVPSFGFLAFWVPRFLGFTSDNNYWGDRNSNFVHILYCGIVAWCLALMLFTKGSRPVQRRRLLALCPPFLLSILMAFDIPLLAPLHKIPLLSATWEVHFTGFGVFAFSVFAALGLEHWFSRPRCIGELRRPLAVLAVIAVIVGAVYFTQQGRFATSGMGSYVLIQVALAAALVAVTLGLLAAFCYWPHAKLLKTALVVVLACDLLMASRGMRPTAPREQAFPETELTSYLQELEQPCRVSVQTTGTIATGIMPVYGIEQLWGYEGIFPARTMHFLEECNTRCWDRTEPLCSLAYYLYPAGALPEETVAGTLERVATIDGIDVFKNLRAFPRAFLVGRVKVVDDTAAAIDALCSPELDLRRVAVTEDPPDAPLPDAESETPGAATVTKRTSLSVEIAVDATEECVLVLTDQFFPGWKASINGRPAEVFPVYYAFRGVVVPAGQHTVEYRYEPWSFTVGIMLSVAALVVSCVVGLWLLVSGKGKGTRHG